jgi:hypothetical protein
MLEIRGAEEIAPALESLKGRAAALYICCCRRCRCLVCTRSHAVGGDERRRSVPEERTALP